MACAATSTISGSYEPAAGRSGGFRFGPAEQDRGLKARDVDRVWRAGRRSRRCSATKRGKTWMLWPLLSATAVGHARSRTRTGSRARLSTTASLDRGVAVRRLDVGFGREGMSATG